MKKQKLWSEDSLNSYISSGSSSSSNHSGCGHIVLCSWLDYEFQNTNKISRFLLIFSIAVKCGQLLTIISNAVLKFWVMSANKRNRFRLMGLWLQHWPRFTIFTLFLHWLKHVWKSTASTQFSSRCCCTESLFSASAPVRTMSKTR